MEPRCVKRIIAGIYRRRVSRRYGKIEDMPSLARAFRFAALMALAVPSVQAAQAPGVEELVRNAITAVSLPSDPRFPIGYQEAQIRKSQAFDAIQKLPPESQKQAVVRLAALLKSGKTKDRAHAAAVLAALRVAALPAERELFEAMKSTDFEVQTQAAQALVSLHGGAKSPLFDELLAPEIRKRLESPDAHRRVMGLVTVSLLGGIASSLSPEVIRLLRDPEGHVRAAAAQTVGNLREAYPLAVPALLPLAQETETWARPAAILALGKMGVSAQPAIPTILAALKSREAARTALGELREQATDALPALVEWLGDPDAVRRSQAAEAIARMGESAQSALPALIRDIADRDADAQRNVFWAIGSMGSASKSATGALLDDLKSGDPYVRKSAANAFGRLPQLASSSVPALMNAARDKDPEVQGAVAQALADLGGLSATAAPRLIDLLSDSRADVRKLAALALGRAGPGAIAALKPLAKMVRSESDAETRAAAIQALGSIRDPKSAAVPVPEAVAALIELVRNPDPHLKLEALNALQSSPTPQAFDDARLALADPSPAIREAAVGVVAAMGPGARPAFATLVALLKDPEPAVARRVGSAMTGLGPQLDATTIGAIAAILGDRKAPLSARLSAVKALCRLEKYALPALPVLVAVFRGPSEPQTLRDHAAFALKIVGGYPPALEPRIAETLKKKKEYFQSIDF